jgi:hypothetical protein
MPTRADLQLTLLCLQLHAEAVLQRVVELQQQVEHCRDEDLADLVDVIEVLDEAAPERCPEHWPSHYRTPQVMPPVGDGGGPPQGGQA